MANLIIEAVPADQTGVATGMNTNIRNIGAALGSGIATSLVVTGLLSDGLPKEHGYIVAFAVSGLALVVAALAALAIPKRTTPSIVEREPHPALTAVLFITTDIGADLALRLKWTIDCLKEEGEWFGNL